MIIPTPKQKIAARLINPKVQYPTELFFGGAAGGAPCRRTLLNTSDKGSCVMVKTPRSKADDGRSAGPEKTDSKARLADFWRSIAGKKFE